MASVKWLTRIQAVREPFHGYWQTSAYAYWESIDGKPVRRALGEMKLKSEIARPRVYETLVPNRIYPVFGAAWAGETDVAEIAVSTDGGQTWAEAEFLDRAQRYVWRRWKFDWLTPKKPGQYTLLARAKDACGLLQPDKHDQNYGSYVINHSLPLEVFVDHSEDPPTVAPGRRARPVLSGDAREGAACASRPRPSWPSAARLTHPSREPDYARGV